MCVLDGEEGVCVCSMARSPIPTTLSPIQIRARRRVPQHIFLVGENPQEVVSASRQPGDVAGRCRRRGASLHCAHRTTSRTTRTTRCPTSTT